jgi:hypothetical protein
MTMSGRLWYAGGGAQQLQRPATGLHEGLRPLPCSDGQNCVPLKLGDRASTAAAGGERAPRQSATACAEYQTCSGYPG